jgi:hypothetical protein
MMQAAKHGRATSSKRCWLGLRRSLLLAYRCPAFPGGSRNRLASCGAKTALLWCLRHHGALRRRRSFPCLVVGLPPQRRKPSLSSLLHQEILMMQAAKHGRLHNAQAAWQLVSVTAGRNALVDGFREART